MKLLTLCVAVCALAGLALVRFESAWPFPKPREVHAAITSRTIVPGVTRFGVNLGGWSFWGAEQLSSNIVKNPGFEGLIDGAIAMPVHSGENSFDDHPAWLARPDGFWEGASYSIRSGPEAGKEGGIVSSARQNLWGLPSFHARSGNSIPDAGDAVALRRDTETSTPEQWWFTKDAGNSFLPELKQKRPGSPGARSLRVIARGAVPAEAASYFDTIGSRAGKLLPLTGQWNLSFWTKLDQGAAAMRVVVGREGAPAALSRDIALSHSWTEVRLSFAGEDSGPPGSASLRFQITGQPDGQVLLDDVDLRRVEDRNLPFRHEVISALERLRPAYLRDWQGQLGDTLANRIAPPFARKSYRYRQGESQSDFGYGLRDFLDLSLKIGAAPWIVLPAAFFDEDCSGLGSYLAAQSDLTAAREILVEFGNENWNETFRPGGIPDPSAHGQAADRCFAAIRRNAPGLPLKAIINAPDVDPRRAIAFAQASAEADIVAVAPYYLYTLSRGAPLTQRLPLLFSPHIENLRAVGAAQKKEIAIYEVNSSTLDGDAPAGERIPLVAGMASGTALAKTMLDALALGARRQCAYTLIGFDAALSKERGFVPLWGLVRDAGPTQRLRPTGLALELLNQAVRGDMQEVELRGASGVSAYAFRSAGGWPAALVSASAEERVVDLSFPPNAVVNTTLRLLRLSAPSLEATNEDSEQVRITSGTVAVSEHRAQVTLEPWSMAVLLPAEEAR